MGGKIGKLIALLTIIGVIMALASCSMGEQGGGGTVGTASVGNEVEGEITMVAADPGLVYVAESLELELPDATAYMQYGLIENRIFYVNEREIVYYSLTDKTITKKTAEWTDAPGEWFFERVAHAADDYIFAEVAVRGIPNLIHYLCKFDAGGRLVFAQELTDYYKEVGEKWSSSNRLEVGTDGCVYLSGKSFIWIFEEDGSYKGNVSFGNVQSPYVKDMRKSLEGDLYVLYENSASGNTYVAAINCAGGKLDAVQKSRSLAGIAADGQTYLAFDATTVYSYDRASLTMTPLFDWTACNIDGTYIYFVQQLADGRIFASSFNYGGKSECFLIQGMTAEEAAALQPEKVEIKLATLSEPSQNLKTAVVFFNRQSDKYNVVLENYSAEVGETENNTGKNRLNNEIAAGKGPDLVHMSFGNVDSLVEKGFYENLYDYLEKSTVISASDFVDVSLEVYNIDDVLVAIPQNIYLQLYLGRKSVVGDAGWTLEEMLDVVEKNADGAIYAEDTNKSMVLAEMLRMNEARFIDRETGKCNFDNELFQRILQFVARFPDDFPEWYEGKTSDYTNIESGNGFLVSMYVSGFRDLQPYSAAYDGDMTCIGYPVEEGIGCLACPDDAIGISAKSQCKEGAWAFLEYYLQYVDLDISSASTIRFPSYEPSLAKLANEAMTDTRSSMRHSSDGWSYKFHTSTQEEIEQVYELIDASQGQNIDVTMLNIIKEEAGSYFAGDKSIEEVVKIIQNRVQLYLEENQ